jgi:hypothetical protein
MSPAAPRAGQEDSAPAEAAYAVDEPKQVYRLGRLLSSTLIRLRSRFDGDLDQYLIYMVFVLSDLSRQLQAHAGTAETRTAPPRLSGLNALSVADITEIPRETVRRKLRLLVDSGLLRLGDDQLFHLAEARRPEEFLSEFASLLRKIQPRP